MQKEEKIPKHNLSPEKIALVNRILKECVKLELFNSEEELDNLFNSLSSYDLNQLNQILDEKLYKKGVDELFSKD